MADRIGQQVEQNLGQIPGESIPRHVSGEFMRKIDCARVLPGLDGEQLDDFLDVLNQ